MKMQIDHLAIWTTDLERLKSFYEKHFSATAGQKYNNPRTGFHSYFLTFGSGPRLELMTNDALTEVDCVSPYPGYAHFALSVGSEDNVTAMTEQLRADGVPVVDGPRRTGDGYFESVVLDPDGNRIEITA